MPTLTLRTKKNGVKRIAENSAAFKKANLRQKALTDKKSLSKINVSASESLNGRTLKIGQPAPDFMLPDDRGNQVRLSDYRGKKVVLYFYPEDDTPACTKEACAFRDNFGDIQLNGAVVLGVSADSVTSHYKFKTKYQLNFPLLSDVERNVLRAYGVWQEKTMFGRTYMGVVRSTFIIDEHGKIAKIFSKVKIDGHVAEILAAL